MDANAIGGCFDKMPVSIFTRTQLVLDSLKLANVVKRNDRSLNRPRRIAKRCDTNSDHDPRTIWSLENCFEIRKPFSCADHICDRRFRVRQVPAIGMKESQRTTVPFPWIASYRLPTPRVPLPGDCNPERSPRGHTHRRRLERRRRTGGTEIPVGPSPRMPCPRSDRQPDDSSSCPNFAPSEQRTSTRAFKAWDSAPPPATRASSRSQLESSRGGVCGRNEPDSSLLLGCAFEIAT